MQEVRFMASVLMYTVEYVVKSFFKPVHRTLTINQTYV